MDFGIGSQLGEAVLARPRFGGAHQSSPDAEAARIGLDVPAFDVRYRHRRAPIGVRSQRNFDKADLMAGFLSSEYSGYVW